MRLLGKRGTHTRLLPIQIQNQAYFPIPSNGGSDLCPTANGCVAVFGTDQPTGAVGLPRPVKTSGLARPDLTMLSDAAAEIGRGVALRQNMGVR